MALTDCKKQIDEILSILTTLPPNFVLARQLLSKWKLPSEALSKVACDIAGNHCFCEYMFAVGNDDYPPEIEKMDENGEFIDEKFVSYYLPEILRLLLEFGMNPNDILEDISCQTNIIEAIKYVDYKYCAANCARILMEHGGNPNLIVDKESIFDLADSDITFDIGYGYDRPHVVRYWLVLCAFGGLLNNGKEPLTMLEEYDIKIFKNYDLYSWNIEWIKPPVDDHNRWIMHLFETSTGNEVARL